MFSGCIQREMTVEFVRFSIKERTNAGDYCLDFTIEFDNKLDCDETILFSDFYIEINGVQNTDVSGLYENEEVFISYPTIKSNETTRIRIRVVDNINLNERNKIIVKYKEKELINDNVFFSKTEK